MKNQNSRGHHIKRLEIDQCLQETDIRIETFVKIDQVSTYLSRSAHRTPNFTKPEIQFPQFKVLQSVFLYNIMSYIGNFGCILITVNLLDQ